MTNKEKVCLFCGIGLGAVLGFASGAAVTLVFIWIGMSAFSGG